MQALRFERLWFRMPLQPDRQASAWLGKALHLGRLYGHGFGMSLQSDGNARAVDGGFAVFDGLSSDFSEGMLLPSSQTNKAEAEWRKEMSNGDNGLAALGQVFVWVIDKQCKGNKPLGCLYAILDLAVLAAVLYGVGKLGQWQGWW